MKVPSKQAHLETDDPKHKRRKATKRYPWGVAHPENTIYSASPRALCTHAKGSSMASNPKQTSSRVASVAGRTLQSSGASAVQKSLAGSALRQAGTPAQTGSRTEDRASRALDNPRSSTVTKTLAGSVVAQSNKRR